VRGGDYISSALIADVVDHLSSSLHQLLLPNRAARLRFTPRMLRRGIGLNFQVTVLKILTSYQDGYATLAEMKRDMAILATSGRDWADRTKRLAMGAPDLDIFSQGLVERERSGWRVTEKGRDLMNFLETSCQDEMESRR
jgi:hypothetical protein